MVTNIYVKAAAVTFIVFISWLGFSLYLDYQRNTSINQSLEEAFLELESTKVLFLYADQSDDTNHLCTAINAKLDSQLVKMPELVQKLEISKKSDLSKQTYIILKKRFSLANAEALYYLNQMESLCNSSQINPVIFFYQESGYCPDCDAQGNILDNVRDNCNNVRVFPFPVDTDLEVINFIREDYGIKDAPAVVVEGQIFTELTPAEQLSQYFDCNFNN